MIDVLTIIITVILLGILFIKMFNLLTTQKLYNRVGSIVLLMIAGMCWGLLTMHFLGSIAYEETSTIVDGASTINVTQKNNVYEYVLPFTYLNDALLFIIFGLTIAENVIAFFPRTRSRYSPKNDQNKSSI